MMHTTLNTSRGEGADERFEFLQCTRGLAALFVVLFHVTLLLRDDNGRLFLGGVFHFGGHGVDIFFALSGFIITHTLARAKGRESYGSYVLRRLTRVYPPYWCAFIGVVLLGFSGLSATLHKKLSIVNIVKAIVLIPTPELPPLGVAWTLSYEVFFYLLAALCLLRTRKALIAIMSVYLVIVCIAIQDEIFHHRKLNEFILWFLFNPFQVEFLLGVLVRMCFFTIRIPTPKTLLLLSIIYLGITAYLFPDVPRLSAIRILVWGPPSACIVLAASQCDLTGSRTKWLRPLIYLGDISYSTYLVHWPLIVGLTQVGKRYYFGRSAFSFCFFGLLLAAAGVLSGSLFHMFVEKRSIRIARKVLRLGTA